MRRYILIIGFICEISHISYGQLVKQILFDEFTISVNRTLFIDNNEEGKRGFGFGAYNSLMSDKELNILFGFEYNQTNTFVKFLFDGHYAYYYDLSYKSNSFSIPLGLRYNIGLKKVVFLESGAFVDLVISSYRMGTHIFYGDPQGIYKDEIDDNAGFLHTFGPYFGFGVLLPFAKCKIVIKTDYKFGINKLYTNELDNDEVIHNSYLNLRIGLRIN